MGTASPKNGKASTTSDQTTCASTTSDKMGSVINILNPQSQVI